MKIGDIIPKIDFVVTWVDENDPHWLCDKEKYKQVLTSKDLEKNSESRYREMNLLRYWFRGVETFAPWVHRIHFVTCGHIPNWLNVNHPKLNLVKHSDFLQQEDLPTFNSNAIELCLHKIEGLSDYFVYFNDDMFLIGDTKENHFFRGNVPCDYYENKAIVSFYHSDSIDYVRLNNTGVINRYFSGRKQKLSPFSKKFSFQYERKTWVKNIVSLCWKEYLGFLDPHLPIAYRKLDFERVWNLAPEELYETCSYKFRTPYDLSHWVYRYARLVLGEFHPLDYHKFSRCFLLRNNIDEICQAIEKQEYKMICINDNARVEEYEQKMDVLNRAFSCVLPEHSSFEHEFRRK